MIWQKLIPGIEKSTSNSSGKKKCKENAVVGPTTHASATQHCTGEAVYVDDMPSPPGAFVRFILSNFMIF